jgi:hypothetical protein
MKTYNEMNLENLSEEELITELSLGKVSTTVLMGRLMMLTRKMKDKQLSEVLKYIGYMVYVNSLQHKKKNKKEQTKPIKRSIVWKHLQDR